MPHTTHTVKQDTWNSLKLFHVKQFEKTKVSVKHECEFERSNDKPFT